MSDYGSDFDAELLENPTELANLVERKSRDSRLASVSILPRTSRQYDRPVLVAYDTPMPWADVANDFVPSTLETELGRTGSGSRKTREDREKQTKARQAAVQPKQLKQAQSEPSEHGTKAPLERFRRHRPLSVTDLTAPAWCELQYWYNLTQYGRVRRTAEMKRGSSVHKVLEEQVHTDVVMDIYSREDGWAINIWNIIQGLRTLRATGLTRELRVWGVIDGQVVNGIVDQLSLTSPDPQLEERLRVAEMSSERQITKPDKNQKTLPEMLGGRIKAALQSPGHQQSNDAESNTIYITDVKTKTNTRTAVAAVGTPTMMQLMLYRSLICNLADGKVDADAIFARYILDPNANFSESLMAEISGLQEEISTDSTAEVDDSLASQQNNGNSEAFAHNNIRKLWDLMLQEFRITLPRASLDVSKLLSVEYRNRNDNSVIGETSFAYNENEMRRYLGDKLSWWRGEREARGVVEEEAFKCRTCEFAAACPWRANQIDHAVQRSRTRLSGQARKLQ